MHARSNVSKRVHGGFLYQRLYAVGCLFLAAKAGASEVVVERDEDIEIETGAQRVYVMSAGALNQ